MVAVSGCPDLLEVVADDFSLWDADDAEVLLAESAGRRYVVVAGVWCARGVAVDGGVGGGRVVFSVVLLGLSEDVFC